MNREIPFLDMRRSPGDIINCWIVYLMPFDSDERSDYDKIHAFPRYREPPNLPIAYNPNTGQKEPLHFGTPIQEGAEIYKERYGPNRSMEYALNQYKSIRKGDYVLMRLKNGHYYVGRTTGSAIYLQQDQEPFANLSWGCQVERWEEYTSEEDIPSELRGRFSQRRHSTIQRMDKYRPRLLTMKLYEDRQAEYHIFDSPERILSGVWIIGNWKIWWLSISGKGMETTDICCSHPPERPTSRSMNSDSSMQDIQGKSPSAAKSKTKRRSPSNITTKNSTMRRSIYLAGNGATRWRQPSSPNAHLT